MTDTAIQEQIKDIKKATDKALQSKEAARKFLADAGILQSPPDKKSVETKKK